MMGLKQLKHKKSITIQQRQIWSWGMINPFLLQLIQLHMHQSQLSQTKQFKGAMELI
jgi:hypothetical protein